MNNTGAGAGNLYYNFEMRPSGATDAGIYDYIVANGVASRAKQTSFDKPGDERRGRRTKETSHSGQSDGIVAQRLFYLVSFVVVISFLTATATLVLAVMMMMSRNMGTHCASYRGKLN